MSVAHAQRELLKLDEEIVRRDSRASFLQFCRHPDLFPGESPATHHEYMIQALERVYRGEIKRLMVLMPPGHGKSVYCSVRFPSWYLGNRPKQHLIHASYGGDLAANDGYKVRNLLDSEAYQQIFCGVRLSEDKQGKSDWATNHNGEFFAIGVGGGVTDRRAHGSLLVDLVKHR